MNMENVVSNLQTLFLAAQLNKCLCLLSVCSQVEILAFKKVPESSLKFPKIPEGSRRFLNVPECS